jgi:hypothetical protein
MSMSICHAAPIEGVEVALDCPPGSSAREPRPVDLTHIPGAELLLSKAWTLPSTAELQLSCAGMPASLWLDGLEGVVLSGASALTREAAGLSSLTAGAVVKRGERFEQSFEGQTGQLHARGVHSLGFVDGTALLCTAVCVGPPSNCNVDMKVSGAFRPARQSSWVMHGLEHAAEHPQLAVASASGLAIALVALILARRPRPRW